MSENKSVLILHASDRFLGRAQNILGYTPSLTVTEKTSDPNQAVELVARTKPRVALVDKALPLVPLLKFVDDIIGAAEETEVVLAGHSLTPHAARLFYQHLVTGFVQKDELERTLIPVLAQAAKGVTSLRGSLLRQMQQASTRPTLRKFFEEEVWKPNDRDIRIMRAKAQGLNATQIAAREKGSPSAVNTRFTAINKQLGTEGHWYLLRFGVQTDLIPPPTVSTSLIEAVKDLSPEEQGILQRRVEGARERDSKVLNIPRNFNTQTSRIRIGLGRPTDFELMGAMVLSGLLDFDKVGFREEKRFDFEEDLS